MSMNTVNIHFYSKIVTNFISKIIKMTNFMSQIVIIMFFDQNYSNFKSLRGGRTRIK